MALLTRLCFACVLMNVIAASSDMCEVMTINTSIFQRNQRLNGFQFYFFTDVPDIFQCAMMCFFRRRCLSFNYFENSSLCEFNNARVDAPYVILNSTTHCVYSDIDDWDKAIGLGPCSARPCDICEACYPTETSYICVKEEVTSCRDIKICTNTTVDGHYLVRPGIGTKPWLKIYCHEMTSKYPKDFLTLLKENFSKVAPFHHLYCLTIDWSRRNPGIIYYNKIRMDLTVLRVINSDRTFTKISCEPGLFGISDPLSFKKSGQSCSIKMKYSSGGDCIFHTCKPRKGGFQIDLRGTGLAVSPSSSNSLTYIAITSDHSTDIHSGDNSKDIQYFPINMVVWYASGYIARISSLYRSPSNEVIKGVCGGNCGYCQPKGYLFLEPKH